MESLTAQSAEGGRVEATLAAITAATAAVCAASESERNPNRRSAARGRTTAVLNMACLLHKFDRRPVGRKPFPCNRIVATHDETQPRSAARRAGEVVEPKPC